MIEGPMILLAGLLSGLALAGPVRADAPRLGADGPAAAISACEAAALAEMQARHPDATEVQALEDRVAVAETEGGRTEVTGDGQFAVEVGVWTPFTYRCAYSPASGQVTSLSLS